LHDPREQFESKTKALLMIEITLFAVTLLLAYANGANDNFKGVATLYGGGVLTYRAAKILSTAATLLGAVAAALLAEQLAKAFSGRGLVPSSVVANPAFAISVAFAAAATVMLATRIGMPISTTHALVGGLAGAGWAAAASALNIGALGQQFFVPLLLGPLAALVLAMALNRAVRFFWPRQQIHRWVVSRRELLHWCYRHCGWAPLTIRNVRLRLRRGARSPNPRR
jgi:inorganic phosphate transporter, PiT family